MREEISAKMFLNESYIQRIRFESYYLSTSIHQACGKQTEESYVCSNFIKNVPRTQVFDEDLLNSALVNAGSVSHFVSCVEVYPHTCTYAGWDYHPLPTPSRVQPIRELPKARPQQRYGA